MKGRKMGNTVKYSDGRKIDLDDLPSFDDLFERKITRLAARYNMTLEEFLQLSERDQEELLKEKIQPSTVLYPPSRGYSSVRRQITNNDLKQIIKEMKDYIDSK